MVIKSSEQVLSGLENSSSATVELLDDAASVIGLQSALGNEGYDVVGSASGQLDTAKFREQWVLRWLIKRLSSVTHGKVQQMDSAFVSHGKLWSLLDHLLDTIPAQVVRDILVERKFAQTLGDGLQLVVQQHTPPGNHAHSDTQVTDSDTGRPTKKRRVSSESAANGPSDLTIKILRVVNRTGTLFTGAHGRVQHSSRTTTVRWTDDPEGAARVLGQVLGFANFALSSVEQQKSPQRESRAIALDAIDCWLKLWSSRTSSATAKLQRDNELFNRYALLQALELLSHRLEAERLAVFSVLERLIATHAILPAREVFQRLNSGTKKPTTMTAARSIIQVLAKELVKCWSLAGRYLSPAAGASLMSIAGRLIPRADIVRRKAESPWLEALFHILCHSVQCVPGFEDQPVGKDIGFGSKNGPIADFSKDYPVPLGANTGILEAFRNLGLEPSSMYWHVCVQDITSSALAGWNVVSQVVGLNSSILIPGKDELSAWFHRHLPHKIQENPFATEEERELLVNKVLGMILEATAKARQLPAWIELWQKEIVKFTEYDIKRAKDESYRPNCAKVWSDPKLLKIFETVCQVNTPVASIRELLLSVEQDLVTSTQSSGSTAQVLACVTILSSVFKPLRASSLGEKALIEHSESLCNAICNALEQSNKYEGQRWRLWSLLDCLVAQTPGSGIAQILQSHKLPWPVLDVSERSKDTTQQPHDMMEQLQSFCLIATLHSQYEKHFRQLFETSLVSIGRILDAVIQALRCTPASSPAWNGLPEDMTDQSKLLSACLTRLAMVPASRLTELPLSHETLVSTIRLACSFAAPVKGSVQSTVSDVAESLLTTVFAHTDTDMIDFFLEAFAEDQEESQIRRIPTLLHRCCHHRISKAKAQRLGAIVLAALSTHKEPLIDAGFIECLSILRNILPRYTTLGDKHWLQYLTALKRSTSTIDLHQRIVASVLIEGTTKALVARTANMNPESRASTLSEVLVWARKKLKEADIGKKRRLLDTYEGYVVLAITRLSNAIKEISDNVGALKAVAKYEALYAELAPSIAKRYLDTEPTERSCLAAWQLLLPLGCFDRESQEDKPYYPDIMKKIDEILAQRDRSSVSPSILSRGSLTYLITVSRETGTFGPSDGAQAILQNVLSDNDNERHTVNTEQQKERQGNNSRLGSRALHNAFLRMLSSSNAKEMRVSENGNQIEPYLSLAAFIKHLSHTALDATPTLVPGLGSLACLDKILEETKPAVLLARLEISRIILEVHPQLINQNIIDSVLGSITLLSTSASKLDLMQSLHDPQPAHIFDRLLSILSNLLIRYRRRLSGRYSLLLPTLQNLLKCLFYPPSRNLLNSSPATYSSKAAFLNSLPHWLNPRSRTSSLTLPSASAAKYSRLLQTFCDPSASSARHTLKRRHDAAHQNNLNLVDETKLLRRSVSYHMQYLLQTYCQAMLDGYIAPEVKEKLVPGLYSVISAMDIGLMRQMNAGMNESQRAIWKDLYSDWRVHGRWNQQ